jgi:serine/threonine protein kinase
MVLDQAGSAVIACDNTRERKLVAIKRFKGIDQSSTRKIPPFRSDHVVNIKETYFDNDDMVIVYEQMDISLRNVTSILQGPFKPFQIATICKGVSTSFNRVSRTWLTPKQLVAGLSYIHEELALYHGELSCGSILLNLEGMVKIGTSHFGLR